MSVTRKLCLSLLAGVAVAAATRVPKRTCCRLGRHDLQANRSRWPAEGPDVVGYHAEDKRAGVLEQKCCRGAGAPFVDPKG